MGRHKNAKSALRGLCCRGFQWKGWTGPGTGASHLTSQPSQLGGETPMCTRILTSLSELCACEKQGTATKATLFLSIMSHSPTLGLMVFVNVFHRPGKRIHSNLNKSTKYLLRHEQVVIFVLQYRCEFILSNTSDTEAFQTKQRVSNGFYPFLHSEFVFNNITYVHCLTITSFLHFQKTCSVHS